MARPVKEGVDYFPLDVAMDTKVELLEAQFGLKGFAVFVKILQYIYGGHGYYGEWTEDIGLLFSRKISEDRNLVSDIVQAAIKRGLFHEGLFQKYAILTSKGIQERYFEMTKKRKFEKVREEYLLVHGAQNLVSAELTGVSAELTPVSSGNNPQSKVNKKKLNKRKLNIYNTSAEADDYVNFADSPSQTQKTPTAKGDRFNYQLFADYWNNHVATSGLASVREPKHWNKNRKKRLRDIVRANGDKTVLKAFDMIAESDFLSGRATDWNATFDWTLSPGNFQKIIEGNYANRSKKKKESYYDKVIRGEA
jgi:hypothetical protein